MYDFKSDLFSEQWMAQFEYQWNNDDEFVSALSQIKFNSSIAYGLKDEAKARGYIEVRKGKVISSGEYSGGKLNWDLRATEDVWQDWFEHPPGLMALGMAYTSQKLKFIKGDYASMIKDPSIAIPFVKSFVLMSRVGCEDCVS